MLSSCDGKVELSWWNRVVMVAWSSIEFDGGVKLSRVVIHVVMVEWS